jgi:hypothetical protein
MSSLLSVRVGPRLRPAACETKKDAEWMAFQK